MNESPLEPGVRESARRRRLGRTVFILPSLFTVGNLFCGYYAVISTMRGHFDQAAQAIGIAIVLDMLDGRIARMTNSATGFGLQLDSLADVISFGIAPSILAFVWGLGATPKIGWIAAFTFTICGAMRLARFNIQAGHLKHFVGLPIPAAGGTIAAVVHFVGGQPINWITGGWIVAAGVFFLAFLMVSTIKYSSFKYLTLGRKSHLTILILGLVFALIYAKSDWTLLGIAAAYVGSGVLMRIYGLMRHRRSGEEIPVPHPAE
jgi:CDP-diacylglycerol---serine O-phosphatidyltransferase